jgi:hypothetical protein
MFRWGSYGTLPAVVFIVGVACLIWAGGGVALIIGLPALILLVSEIVDRQARKVRRYFYEKYWR